VARDYRREARRDPFHRAAKATGYRARSAFKLKQIHERHHVMKKGGVVVDLGAAPGGWSQVAKESVGDTGVVVAVDLAQMRSLPGVRMLRGDMTKEETVIKLLAAIEAARGVSGTAAVVDTVVSDMSPKLSGTYSMDQARSYFLALHALQFAERVLAPGGNFVAKIFEGEDFIAFRDELREKFASVRTYHPPASRKTSSEVYVIAKGYKRPAGEDEPAAGPVPA
jgi:23S rRNA (uridine2552-2'-O)-methyltransferase